MSRRNKKNLPRAITWLSNTVVDPNCLSNSFLHYEKFQFQNIVAGIGDFVLISNADAAEPDTEDGCDAARIVSLYEDSTNQSDPFRAKVQWYSRPSDLPSSCINNMEPVDFLENEVVEDHRPFNTDVSIETFFKKCSIIFTFTKDTDHFITKPYHYLCRYRVMSLSKRKVIIEPVTEDERKAIQLLYTPTKGIASPKGSKTPTSLVKKMNGISLSEQKNWSVSKTEGTKLLLKRAILADKIEKDSPKKTLKIYPSPKSTKQLSNSNIEEILSMELKENSDDDLPTLIIRQAVPVTPKRRQSILKSNDETPKRSLAFDDEQRSPHSKQITQNVPLTPKRRQSVLKTNLTPRKTPALDDDDQSSLYTTKSGRVAKKKVNYIEEEVSPVKRPHRRTRKITESDEDFRPAQKIPVVLIEEMPSMTPVKASPRRTKITEDDEEFKPVPKTPKTPRTPRTPKTPGQTPKQRVSRKILSQLTPTLRARAHSVDNNNEFGKDNNSLPGRENQLDEILSFVRIHLIERSSGCMYISGVPGTGKTATVCSALDILKDEAGLPEFQLVEVNGMRITEPRQAYVHIYKQLTGKSVVWGQACSLLEKRFTNPGPRRIPTVLLVDELDALCTRRQDVLYSIMEWAGHDTALLTVLAVANTMDLPERALATRVASRLGLTRLTFPPYTHAQLQTIVATRLAGARVSPDAIQLIARKVAAVSGDARRALALCARAVELAPAGAGAGLAEVARALAEAASGAAVAAIRRCSPAERLILRAVAAEVERTGTDETTLSRALSTAAAIVSLDGRPYRSAAHVRAPTASQALAVCARLAALRLILMEPKPAEPRLLLNVSVDDVHYATKQISV